MLTSQFCQLVREREEGDHDDATLRARFDDADLARARALPNRADGVLSVDEWLVIDPADPIGAIRSYLRDLNRDVRVSMQTSMEEFRTKKVFKLPEGIDTSFETPELQTLMASSSGGALNLSAISASSPGKPNRSASAMEMRRPNSRGGGGNMSMASVDSGTTMVSSPCVTNRRISQLDAHAVELNSVICGLCLCTGRLSAILGAAG